MKKRFKLLFKRKNPNGGRRAAAAPRDSPTPNGMECRMAPRNRDQHRHRPSSFASARGSTYRRQRCWASGNYYRHQFAPALSVFFAKSQDGSFVLDRQCPGIIMMSRRRFKPGALSKIGTPCLSSSTAPKTVGSVFFDTDSYRITSQVSTYPLPTYDPSQIVDIGNTLQCQNVVANLQSRQLHATDLPHPFNQHLTIGAKTGKSAEAEKSAN